MQTGTYLEAYAEGQRRWEMRHGLPDTILRAAKKEAWARDFAHSRFPNRETNAIRLQALKNLERHRKIYRETAA